MKYRTVAGALAMLMAVSAAPALANTQMSADRESTGLARQVLQDADSARSALMNNDTVTAKRDIGEAMAARDKMLQIARPTGSPTIVPIFSELDDAAVITPAGTKKTAKPTVAGSTGSAPVTVRANDARYTYLAIDLTKTKARLDAATTALRNNNRQAAEDSLDAIGTDVIASTDQTDVPLLTASEDLALAQQALHAKELSAVGTDLRQASTALKAYSRPSHLADAQRLANEIQDATPITAASSSSAAAKIDAWWSSLKVWFGRHV